MTYHYKNKSRINLIIVLHGTGGNETSLVPLAQYIDENSSILGIKGNIKENGLNRYFKRIKPGIFDERSLLEETEKLNSFINDFIADKKFEYSNIVIMGYSNGANILGSLLFRYTNAFKAAILIRPMIPTKIIKPVNQEKQKILITYSSNDPLVKSQESQELGNILINHNGLVDLQEYTSGHQINQIELENIKEWYEKL